MAPKIEIIDIDIGLDLAQSIKDTVDSIDSNVSKQAQLFIKAQKHEADKKKAASDGRKKRKNTLKIIKDAAIKLVADKLIELSKDPMEWTVAKDLMAWGGITDSKQLNKLAGSITKYLSADKKWRLKRKQSRVYGLLYRVDPVDELIKSDEPSQIDPLGPSEPII